MAYEIKKSKEFLRNVVVVLTYLEIEWGMKSAQRFQFILDSKLYMLSKNPTMGRITSKNKNIWKLTITKHNKIYYRIRKDQIFILTLFENKMNSQRNKYE